MRKCTAISIFLFCAQLTCAQNGLPVLSFLSDTLILAEPIKVALVYTHPKEQEVFFPKDSKWFKPFEKLEETAFPTITVNGLSTDSVVYTLKCFEVDSLQTLQLPVWLWKKNDSVSILSTQDTIWYKTAIDGPNRFIVRDDLVAVDNSSFKFLKYLPWIALFSGLAIVFILFFRRPLQRLYFKLLFDKKHRSFSKTFKKSMKLGTDLPQALSNWKKHMEWLEGIPYASMSTSEIVNLSGDDSLGDALKELDASIYGGQNSERISLALQVLLQKSIQRYKVKRRVLLKSLK